MRSAEVATSGRQSTLFLYLFLEACKKAQCVGLAGHRSVGGFRASLYNALGLDSVNALVSLMQEFESQNA